MENVLILLTCLVVIEYGLARLYQEVFLDSSV